MPSELPPAYDSHVLAGTPETAARVLPDDVDVLPMRGYQTHNDSFERHVISIVRGVARRGRERGPRERGTPVCAR